MTEQTIAAIIARATCPSVNDPCIFCRDKAERSVTAITAAGYVLLPRKVTPEMVRMWLSQHDYTDDGTIKDSDIECCQCDWDGLIAAVESKS